ncbi:hypothetical protein [Rhodovulum sulfidophilum]|uniref:hypothetical protein n=1 Tax=Rhodovulum sulfidophilum TaxID=35806 RepID=UPI000950E36C|nr:hypothetical protein [Rhodovulum sulfidophilum]MBL3551340.1 hypothetical protein [Rhodovulum sulfidophilum]OLS47742.1 hypothetical protein BV379_05210 [Rhodovulum sulfidophilum]
MTTRPRNHGRPAYNENGSADAVTVTDNEATAILQGAGLSIKRVTRSPSGQLTAQWRKEPTDADKGEALKANTPAPCFRYLRFADLHAWRSERPQSAHSRPRHARCRARYVLRSQLM